jgi:phage shock protein E
VSRRSVSLIVLVLVAVFAAGACSDEATADPLQTVSAEDAVEMIDRRVVIDVRTAAEYAQDHVVGALNIVVNASDFNKRIEDLDKADGYLVYCRSGRRSAIAADAMVEAGFTDIVDAGSISDLAAAGAPIE